MIPCDASVAVGERVNFGDQEHHIDGAREWRFEAAVKVEALGERAFDMGRIDEDGLARAISLLFEFTGSFLARGHQRCMTALEEVEEHRRIARRATHFVVI